MWCEVGCVVWCGMKWSGVILCMRWGVVCSGVCVMCVTYSDGWFGVIWSSVVFCGVVRCSV